MVQCLLLLSPKLPWPHTSSFQMIWCLLSKSHFICLPSLKKKKKVVKTMRMGVGDLQTYFMLKNSRSESQEGGVDL